MEEKETGELVTLLVKNSRFWNDSWPLFGLASWLMYEGYGVIFDAMSDTGAYVRNTQYVHSC